MSVILPTNNTSIIVDDFIAYAIAHLQTVSGIINTLSTYPPLPTPAPGVILWTGYTVEPPKQQPGAGANLQADAPLILADGTPVDNNYTKPPAEESVSPYQSKIEDSGESTLPPGSYGKFVNPSGVGNYNPEQGTPINTTPAPGGNTAPIGGDDLAYGGYVKLKVDSNDKYIRDYYVPALNTVHADKSKGIRLLMTAQTYTEGFYPAGVKDWHKDATPSWLTNNPGNVYPNGNKSGFKSLQEGVRAQWEFVLGPTFLGKSPYYKTSFSLFQYISQYAPKRDNKGKIVNNPTEYTNSIIAWFKANGYDITANTTLEQIKNITK
ncbi:MAG: hypothetical protein RLZZ196_3034 [Bacteroidota bacterium]|jgi:hypothetical protein